MIGETLSTCHPASSPRNHPGTVTIDVDLSRVDELSGLAVPNWVRGVWQRTKIRGGGPERRNLIVNWIQTPTLYADIRWPAAGDVTTAREEGFAGWLDVEGQVCRWQRPIDLNPAPENADQGAMFRDDKTLIEVGLLANYLEGYRLVEPATRCFAASRGAFAVKKGRVQFASRGMLDILVSAGPYLTHARRAGSSGLRHGRYDANTGTAHFELSVGDPTVFAGGSGTWTVWTDDVPDRDVLLVAASASAAPV